MFRAIVCPAALAAAVRSPIVDFTEEKPLSLAVQVTRLFRHEHAGDEAMIEFEAQWLKKDDEGAQSLAEKPKVARFSSKQISWLEQHQKARHENRDGLHVEAREHSYLKLRQHARAHKQDGPAAVALVSANSQYLGPVGVGTKLSGQECKEGQALSEVPFRGSADSSLAQADTTTCHTESQTTLNMVWDTGSTNIWVNSDLCTAGSCAEASRSRFESKKSLTFVPPQDASNLLKITFGTGSLEGTLAGDDFHIGSYTIGGQTFGMIQSEEGSAFETTAFEGIMGLGFPSLAANGETPFFDNIVDQNVLNENKFAFYFSLDNPSANALLLGGVDSRFYQGDLKWFPVTQPHYWSLDLLSFSIGDEEILGESTTSSSLAEAKAENQIPKAIVDSGTTYLTAQGETYTTILEKLKEMTCSKMTDTSHPDLKFTLKGEEGPHTFVLRRDQYMVERSNGECSPAFMEVSIDAKHGPAMILGDVWMRQFFTVHDRADGQPENARVGFAEAKHGTETENYIKELTSHQPSFQPKSMGQTV